MTERQQRGQGHPRPGGRRSETKHADGKRADGKHPDATGKGARPTDTKRVEDWSQADYAEHGRLATAGHKLVVRRRRKKARIAAMTRRRRVTRRFLVAGTWLLGFVAVLMVGVIVAYYTLANVRRPEDVPLAQVATIQYSDGSTLTKIGTVDRTLVSLSQVPENVRWAVLAAEDRGFYDNGAVSIRGTVRAAVSDLRGGDTQGGSGITQQYVKNAYLTNSPTLSRKLKELMIAVKLSREYSKDQILEFYLNTVYFGRGAYGIQAAARVYFGLDVSKLDTAQGALLAGLLRAPSYYDPAVNKRESEARWGYVLDGMVTTGHLAAATRSSLQFPATKPVTTTGLVVTGWKYLLRNAVLQELARQGITQKEINDRGLIIRTTIDRKAQAAALAAIRSTYANLTTKQRNIKNSLVAINPSDGGVLAYYPGTGPGVKGNDGKIDYNDWAQQRANAPGSSFKPYVLATVLTQTLAQKPGDGKIHYAINSKVDGSQCKKIEGTTICNDPQDKDKSGSSVTITHAMRYSLNTTFDDLASQAGPAQVAAMAHKLGVAAVDSAGHKTLVSADGQTAFGIGIGDYPATTLDQASGYATLAAGGVHNDPFLVQQATASDGEIVYKHETKPTRAIDTRVANDVTLTLENVAADAGKGLAGGRMSAAKTGTEGVSGKSVNNSDAWMVGYTPQVAAAVWTGTGARAPIFDAAGNPEYGSDLSATAWKAFMDDYLKSQPKLKLANRQLISAQGKTIPVPPKVTYTPPPPSSDPVNSPTPPPSSSSSAPTTSAPTSSYSPPPIPSVSPPPSAPTAPTNCGGLLEPACPTP